MNKFFLIDIFFHLNELLEASNYYLNKNHVLDNNLISEIRGYCNALRYSNYDVNLRRDNGFFVFCEVRFGSQSVSSVVKILFE